MAVDRDANICQKETKIFRKYKGLEIEVTPMWNLKTHNSNHNRVFSDEYLEI